MIADVNALRVVVAQGSLDEGGRRQLRGRERATREQPLGLLPQLQVEQPHDEAQLGLELPRRQGEVEVDDVALVAEHERLRAALRQACFELGHVHVAQLDDLHLQQPQLLGGANGQPFGAVDENGVGHRVVQASRARKYRSMRVSASGEASRTRAQSRSRGPGSPSPSSHRPCASRRGVCGDVR